MTPHDCPREQELVDALTTEQWPERAGADLRTHVSGCALCRDLVTMFAPLRDGWAETRGSVQVPAAGMVWWRAQMRARQEAARAATRPIAVAQIVGGLVAVAAVTVCVVLLSPWLLSFVAASRAFLRPETDALSSLSIGWMLGGVLAVAAATSLAVYLAVAEE